MQAVILLGGQGTRLQPLTLDLPKPLFPICGRPFSLYQLNLLKKYGVTDVIFSLGYRWDDFLDCFKDGSSLGISIRYVVEDSPLGTGGAIRNVKKHLDGNPFLVLNGDILSSFDIGAFIDYHKKNNARCTIALTPVEDPSMYGVVEMDDRGRVEKFTEKPPPGEARSDQINAGLYLMEPDVLDMMEEGRVYSVEREIFPRMLAQEMSIYGFSHNGYWMDIGTPEKYLAANFDILTGDAGEMPGFTMAGNGITVDPLARIEGPVFLGNGAVIGKNCVIEGPAVIGSGCVLAEGARLKRTLLWDRCAIGSGSDLSGCILGRGCRIGRDVQVDEGAVIQSGVFVEDAGHVVRGKKVFKEMP